jgi:hypothetical protein
VIVVIGKPDTAMAALILYATLSLEPCVNILAVDVYNKAAKSKKSLPMAGGDEMEAVKGKARLVRAFDPYSSCSYVAAVYIS